MLEGFVDQTIDFIQTNRSWMTPAVFALAFGESLAGVSLLLPFWALLVGIGALVVVMSPEFMAVWVAASVGAALGDWVSFLLGYYCQARIAASWPLNKHPELLPRARAFLNRYGAWAIVLGRFSGPFRATVPLVAGAVHMNAVTFQAANWSSAFLWAFVLLVFGGGLGMMIDAIAKALGWS
ncbi:MAG: DedA family protein [Hyphomicrobiaceae bacterium]